MSKNVINPDTDWMQEAYCKNIKTEIFFTEDNRLTVQIAKSACAQCIVIDPCLDYAISNQEQGIWGGTTRGERLRSKSPKANYVVRSI